MQLGSRVWKAHPTLSRPLTVLGVERKWFFLALTLALAMWNAIGSLLTAATVFLTLYLTGFVAWKRDPAMLNIIVAGSKARARYDPGKPSDALVELLEPSS